MAHAPSASKRHRQSLRRRDRNQARRGAARTAVRRARDLIAAGDQEEARAAIRAAGSILDRAARRGVVHPNNAARRKSRLMRRFNALQATPAEEAAPRKRRARTTSRTKAPASKTTGRSTRTKKS